MEIIKNIENQIKKVNFLDFGSSKGDSLIHMQKQSNTAGLGLDLDPNKIAISKKRGLNTEHFDILKLINVDENAVQFISMFHFLEHLYSNQDAASIINVAIKLSNDFVFIKQPFFDEDGFLFKNNLKLFWSHWRGHNNHMTTWNFYTILNEYKKKYDINFTIGAKKIIRNSNDKAILPFNTVDDQHFYNRKKHGNKQLLNFAVPIYYETVVFIEKNTSFLCEKLKKEYLEIIYYKS